MMSIALLAPLAATAQQTAPDPGGIRPDGRGHYIRQTPQRRGFTAKAVVTGNGISYHNGPVMHSGVNLYYIWYGNWAQDPKANAILTDLAKNLGGSPYYMINTTYADTVANVTPNLNYITSIADPGSMGTALPDNGPLTLVNNALTNGTLPADPNGVYFVLTAPYVTLNGFGTVYCGWHNITSFNGVPIKFSFIGNPAANLSACSAQNTSPNGSATADAMASLLVHELQEAITDPELTAWYDDVGNEIGDKCAWTYGATYNAPNGTMANMKLGLRDFLIQQNWVNAAGGYCATAYDNTPDFSLAVSPVTQTIAAGATTAAYVMTATPANGWTGTVSYSVTGLPNGATAKVVGNQITVATTTSLAAGTYSFTIAGTDGKKTHTIGAYVVVAAPTFTLTLTPSAQTITRPSSGSATATYTVTVTSVGGFAGTVNLTASGGTTGLTVAVTPATITGSGTAKLTATVTNSARSGTRSLSLKGTSGSKSVSATASLTVK